jgi:histidinol-phosphate aminotransferase
MNAFWSKTIKNLDPYVPGEQPKDDRFIKLNTNENPYSPSPKVLTAIQSGTDETLRLYPDPNSDALKSTIAKYYNLSIENVFVGNGSDEILALTFLAFFKRKKPILFPDITYSFYEVYCSLFDIRQERIPLTEDFSIPLSDFMRSNGGIIFPNPNAPTGLYTPVLEIEQLLRHSTSSLLVIDEAYIDFGGDSAVSLIGRFPNILIIQTLSKSRSLAGLRVGLALGPRDIIAGLERAKNAFNSYPLDRLAQRGAIASFRDDAYFQKTRQKVMASREWTRQELDRLGFSVVPSKANFLFIRHKIYHARELFAQLRKSGVLVRYFDKPRIDNYLRVTIGTQNDMGSLIQVLENILGSESLPPG